MFHKHRRFAAGTEARLTGGQPLAPNVPLRLKPERRSRSRTRPRAFPRPSAPIRPVYPPSQWITLPAEGGTANGDADLAQAVGLDKKAAAASGAFPASIPLDAQERQVDPRQIRALHHATGVCYLDFTPVMIVTLAPVVGARDLAIGAGDTGLYGFAGMRAAVVLSIRGFLVRGAGKANERRSLPCQDN